MRIDLRCPTERQALGLTTETVSAQSQPYQQKRTRRDTETAILDALYEAARPLSRLDICRAVGRAKSPHLIAVIDALHADGEINRAITTGPNGNPTYVYFWG